MMNKYLNSSYNSKNRWVSYWHQISEALEISPSNILVVGKGSGIVDNAIKQLSGGEIKVVTLDIDKETAPDVVGDVTDLPFEDNSFDAAVCCQVLEHIPFDRFSTALSELRRVTKKRLVLSLPHKRKSIKISYALPNLGEKTLILKNPFTKKRCTSKNHCWEIGRGVSRRQTLLEIEKRFEVEKEFLNEMSCEHRFFILKRKD